MTLTAGWTAAPGGEAVAPVRRTRSEVPPHSRRRLSLWNHDGFRKLWWAQGVSVLGSQITEVALPLTAAMVLDATALQVGLLAGVQYLPFLLLGLPAGAWVDRMRRKPIMVVTHLARFAVLLTIPAAALGGVLQLWLLFPVAFLVGVSALFFDVAAQSFLPTVVGEHRLVEGNTRLQVSQTVGQLAGPGLGGLLVQLLTAPAAILANGIGHAVSGLLVFAIRAPEQTPARDAGRRSLTAEIRDGLRFVFRHPLLKPIAVSAGIGNFFGVLGMLQAVLTLYAVKVLGLLPVELGIALAAANAGVLLGAAVNRRLVGRFGVGHTLGGVTVLMGLGILLMPLAGPATAMLLLSTAMAVCGVCAAVFNVNQVSLRQAVTPAAMRGRMTATLRLVIWGAIPLGTVTGGLLAGWLGLRGVLWLAGVGSVLAVLPLLSSAVRSQRTIPTAVGVDTNRGTSHG